MTATIQPPRRENKNRDRRVRFSSMESLGLSDSSATWSDNPVYAEIMPRGRHEATPPLPDAFTDWQPQDIGRRLQGRNYRLSVILVSILVVAAVAAVAYYVYQQPAIEAGAAAGNAAEVAATLDGELSTLESVGGSLSDEPADAATSLFGVDSAARSLFDASGGLASESSTRTATAGAASAALDGVRLASETGAYIVAVTPILDAPELETDPNLIELDEAARAFGEWQLAFDQVRTALPDAVLSDITEQLDILSGDLSAMLTSYIDALRSDDASATTSVVTDLTDQLTAIGASLADAVEGIENRILDRVEEARAALSSVVEP